MLDEDEELEWLEKYLTNHGYHGVLTPPPKDHRNGGVHSFCSSDPPAGGPPRIDLDTIRYRE
jgi:hypothetical protein